MTLLGAPPPPLAHPPVAIVPYYLYTIVQIFSIPVIQRHRNAPPPPMGAGLAQGGHHLREKRFSTAYFFMSPHNRN